MREISLEEPRSYMEYVSHASNIVSQREHNSKYAKVRFPKVAPYLSSSREGINQPS